MIEDKYVDVAGTGEIPEGCVKVIEVDNTPIAICRLGEEFYAVHATCTHDNYRFESGPLDDDEITCPRHGARFDPRTGAVRRMPAVVPVKTYPTRLDSGRVLVCFEED